MRLGILIGAVLTASASLASLAAASDHWLGIEMGASIPHGSFSDDANTGTLLGFDYTYKLNTMVGFGLGAQRHGWLAKQRVNAAADAIYGTGSRYLLTAWEYTVNATVFAPLRGPAKPYLTTGIADYNPGFKLQTPSGDFTDTRRKAGFEGGAGVEVSGPHGTSFDAFATFHRYSGEPRATSWTSAGLRVNINISSPSGIGF